MGPPPVITGSSPTHVLVDQSQTAHGQLAIRSARKLVRDLLHLTQDAQSRLFHHSRDEMPVARVRR